MQLLRHNNKDQQAVAKRLTHINKSATNNKFSKDSYLPYLTVGILAFIACLLVLFVFIPGILNNFPLHLLRCYPLNLINNLRIIGLSLFAGVAAATILYFKANGLGGLNKTGEADSILTTDNQDDAQIDLPEDLPRKYNIMPDNKVHSDINITALLSHMMFKDSRSIHGLDGNVHFDNDFSEKLFDTADLPNDKKVRIIYDAAKIAYNPTHEHGKPDYATVKDYINNDWYVPEIEEGTQDPAGVYIVSTSPENTVVVSETRGGKGVKYIEPILDAWSRQKHLPNIVITDLKMELLRMYLRTFTLRGYNVKALNLMVPSQTDAINFLGYAVDAAIKGDVTQMEKEVTSVSDVFFVNKGQQDPMWNQAASATFKRTVYLLINYYSEQVKALREDPSLSIEEINHRSDEMWGKVTLYNAYRLTVDMAGKSYPNEAYADMYPKINGVTTDPNPEETSKSALTVYCDAIDLLPTNSIRAKIADQNKTISLVGPAEKTLASIYAVCMFGMIFFTDNTIIRLTSARPSANLDLKGFAFPRRMGVSFDKPFADRYNLVQAATVWEAYHDPAMTKPYKGDDFRYEGNIDDFRWAYAYFRGKFDDAPVYLKLTIYARNGYISKSPNNLKIKEFDFVFRKSYRKSYSGKQYLINPITGEREVQGGEMNEYTYDKRTHKVHQIRSGIEVREHSLLFSDNGAIKTKTRYTIESYDIHYTDKPTALFLVTSEPSYNKVLLMTLNNLYNQQVALCKVVFNNQKPVVPTKYLLDEFGNIKSEGQGVPDLDTKLDSGLGFEQQFTLILQSLSQLTTLYDNAVKETLIANSANFFFMKSKDKTMIHQLMDMNGKIHVPVKSSVTIQKQAPGASNFFGNPKEKQPHQGPSVSISRNEQPLLDENAYLQLNHKVTDGNAIVSRGDSTILSIRNTMMPVSFVLLANNLGKHGSIDTGAPASLPTMSDTNNFNALQNIPDFDEMIASAMEEAKLAPKVIEQYKKVEHKTDRDIQVMDPDVFADIIMSGIRLNLRSKETNTEKTDLDRVLMHGNDRDDDEHFNSEFDDMPIKLQSSYTDKALNRGDRAANFAEKHAQSLRKRILAKRSKMLKNRTKVQSHEELKHQLKKSEMPNKDFLHESAIQKADMDHWKEKIYADRKLARIDLELPNGMLTGTYDHILSVAFGSCYASFRYDRNFILNETAAGPTLETTDQQPAITVSTNADGSQMDDSERFHIQPAFINYLISLDSWSKIANGRFEQAVVNALNASLK